MPPCPECKTQGCPGPGVLREFVDWADLSTHASEEDLVKWVSHYARLIEARNSSGAKYRKKQQIMSQIAARYLDKDELDRVEQLVEERLNGPRSQDR